MQSPNDQDSGNEDRTSGFVRLFAACERVIYKTILNVLPDWDAAQEVFPADFGGALAGSSTNSSRVVVFRHWASRVAYFEVLRYRQTRRRDRLLFSDELLGQLAEAACQRHGTTRRAQRGADDLPPEAAKKGP